MKHIPIKTSLVIATAVSMFVISANAQNTISINFDSGSNSINTVTDNGDGRTGAVDAPNWNSVDFGAAGTPNTASDLLDDAGTPTTASISLENLVNTNSGGFGGDLAGSSDEDVLDLYAYRNRNDGMVASLSSIPFSQYDVYIYFGSVDSTFQLDDGTTVTDVALDANGTSNGFTLATASDTGFNDEGAGNYYVFEGLTATSFTVTSGLAVAGATANNGFSYGMQVVAVPEPSSLALIAGALGLTSVMLRRRRS